MCSEELVSEFFSLMRKIGKKNVHKQMQNSAHGAKFILLYVSHHDGEATPGDLSREMKISSARIAAALKDLEEKGFVKRETDSEDRRRTRIRITQTGKNQIEEHHAKIRMNTKKMFEYLGEEDSKELLRLLKKLSMMEWKEDEE